VITEFFLVEDVLAYKFLILLRLDVAQVWELLSPLPLFLRIGKKIEMVLFEKFERSFFLYLLKSSEYDFEKNDRPHGKVFHGLLFLKILYFYLFQEVYENNYKGKDEFVSPLLEWEEWECQKEVYIHQRG
jgi:hypothetical protein